MRRHSDPAPIVTDRMTAGARSAAVGDAAAVTEQPPTDPVGPSHVDGRLQLALGLLGLVVGAAVLVQAWVPVLRFPVALVVELWVAGLAVVFGLLALRSGLVWTRARRTARRSPTCVWSGVCLQPEHDLRLRVLVVDAEGVALRGAGGLLVSRWAWAELTGASVEPLHIHRRLHPGLLLRAGGEVVCRVAFPGRVSGFRYDVAWFAAAAVSGGLRPGPVLRSGRT
jgi:hypothetical protein